MPPSEHNYASYKLKTISEIVDVADALRSLWVFRGHSHRCWNLESSLERETRKFNNGCRAEYENKTLKHIMREGQFDGRDDFSKNDPFSYLALLQHHGCKTRLLDFTRSFYIALYFAVRDISPRDNCQSKHNCDCEAAIWGISTAHLDAKTAILGERIDSPFMSNETACLLVNNSIELPERYIGMEQFSVVRCVPERINQRMSAQHGLFICPLNLERSFIENLTIGLGLTGNRASVQRLHSINAVETEAKEGKVIKIIVPQDMHLNILYHLRKMNLTDAILFPGLDGYARSLNYFASGEG